MRLDGLTFRIVPTLGALMACLPFCARAVPVMDGERDTEYALVATSPKDNLLVDAAAVPPINDPASSRYKCLDVTGMWATNTGASLYLYIELPYLDLNTIEGEWAVAFHLKGANDAIERLGAVQDPYSASVDFGHAPACNAVLKSNMRGYNPDYDGNEGWAFLIAPTKAANDWDWGNSNFLGSMGWASDTVAGTCTGTGALGAGVVYKAGKGIEVSIPLSFFAINPANTNLTNPQMGDVIQMQFYANARNRTSPLYPRGPIDCVPFDAGSRIPATRGRVSTWASYTLKAPLALEVTSAQLNDISDLTHISVAFSSALGPGAATTTNYTVANVSSGTTIPVTSAAVSSTGATRAILGVALPFNARLRVTVSNVMGANGATVSSTLNTAEMAVGTPVQFNLYDTYGVIAALGTDPATGQPYAISLTGDMIGWRDDPEGATEIAVAPVSGEAGHYRTQTLILPPGVMEFKYRVPHIPNSDNWNVLNPNDRRFFVPATASTVQTTDNAAGSYAGTGYYGGSLQATFTLVDTDDVAAGRLVYLTGELTNWSTDPGVAIPMPAVAGQPHTYRATFTLPDGYGRDVTTKYKYIVKPDPVIDPGTPPGDELNPFGDRWAIFRAPAGRPVASVTDILGGSRLLRMLRAAAGLDPAPMWSGYYADLDVDMSGDVSLLDIAAALRQDRLGALTRIHAQGTKMVNASGTEITLRGVNLGGWFVEEMWMSPWVQNPPSGSAYPKAQDHVSLWSVITQRLGATAAQNVKTAYRNAWIQPADFQRIKTAGFNLVRLPFIYDIVDEPDGMTWLQDAVLNANIAGLYVILDMHGAPGSQNPWDHSGQVGINGFFGNPANIAKGAQVWARIARQFAGNPGVLGCDLLNEPAGAPDSATLHLVHNQLYQAIRAVAPDMLVIIEDGYKGFGSMPPPSLYGWTNVVYSTHLYDFNASSPQAHLDSLNAQLPGLIQYRANFNVPVFIGEFNLEPNNSANAMTQYTRTLSNNGLFWTLWTFKTVATGGPMGYWGYYSNPTAVNPLNPFLDSEATLISKSAQVRTVNLTIPAGLAAALQP